MGNLVIIGIVLLAIVLLGIIASGYVKAPPNTAYIISGYRKDPKILIGRAGIKIPILERKDTLILKQISIDIKTNGYVPTLDFIGVDIDAVAKVRIKSDDEGIKLAMKNFLNMNEASIIQALTDSLQGNMREIIGTVSLKELNTDRKKFGDEVQMKAQTDMNALGIEIISCNIQKIEDEQNLITALGQDNMSQIQKVASIAKAQAEKDIAIAEAEAYPGPSLIIAYAPCINHGIKKGMAKAQTEEELAVKAGYWHCFRYNPAAKAEGKDAFTLDSKAPTGEYQEFLNGEVRYNSLMRSNPEKAKKLFAKNEAEAKARYEYLNKLITLYGADKTEE